MHRGCIVLITKPSRRLIVALLILTMVGIERGTVCAGGEPRRSASSGQETSVKRIAIRAADVSTKDEMIPRRVPGASLKADSDQFEMWLPELKGADVNLLTALSLEREHFKTPLIWAMVREGVEKVRYLLDFGVHVRPADSAVLLWAVQWGHGDVARRLLDKGLAVNAANWHGWTALMIAAFSGRSDLVKLLIDRGADVNVKDRDGRTGLMWAAFMGHTDVVNELLGNGATVNAKDKDGRTALMWAAELGDADVVRILLKNGADVLAKNANGRTALQEPRVKRHEAIMRLLKRHLHKE